MFGYDSQAPLEVQEHEHHQRDDLDVYEISYASPRGGRVPAFLILPERASPLAGILYMHPGGTDKRAFLEEAMTVCQAGAAALLIDAKYARQPGQPIFSFTEQDHDDLVQNVADLRRGVDVLTARPDIDAERIGYVGFSYGAAVGALLAGIEKRIRAYIIWAGGAHMAPVFRDLGKAVPQAQLDAYIESMAALDPVHYIGQATPSTLYFQNGGRDKSIPQDEAEALHQAASEPKTIAWYDATHALDGKACRDRFEWLREQLGLDPLPPALIKALGKFKLKQMARPKWPAA